MTFKTLAALAALGIGLSGCATILKGTSQSIAISTPPVSGAYCVLTSKEGSWTVMSPGAVTVNKTKEDILIKCQKPGYQDAVATIPSDFQGWTLGDLLIPGGLIAVGVDASTGAMNEYPHSFAVPMTPGEGTPMPTLPNAPIDKADKKPGT